ncbi:hypothetical protein RQP46_009437 [Phenoliferia psychrophenolica]
MHSAYLLSASLALLSTLALGSPDLPEDEKRGLVGPAIEARGYMNGFLCSVTIGILCGGGGGFNYGGGGNNNGNQNSQNSQQTNNQQVTINNNYIIAPQQGYPGPYWQSSGCGCDGYAFTSQGQSLPSNYPDGFQYYGTQTGWAPPQHWKVPSEKWVAPATAEKSFSSAKWWAPQQKWVTPPKKTPSWWYNGTAPATKSDQAPDKKPEEAAKPVSVRDLHRRGTAFNRDISG